MLITFSGLDGAGKSTLIEWLKTALEEQDRRVTVFHLNDHIGLYAYARFVRDLLRGGRRQTPGARREISAPAMRPELRCPRSGRRLAPGVWRLAPEERFLRLRYRILWNKAARRWIYLLDLVIFLLYRLYLERIKKEIILMDRYFYDTLVDLTDERSPRFTRTLARLTPTPTVPIFVDVAPEAAFARKREYSVEYLARRRVTYRRLFREIPRPVVLENEELNATQRALANAVMERIASR